MSVSGTLGVPAGWVFITIFAFSGSLSNWNQPLIYTGKYTMIAKELQKGLLC